jgi:hypothetical protein
MLPLPPYVPGETTSSDLVNFMGVIKGIQSSPDSYMQEKTGRAICFSDQAVWLVFFSRRRYQEFSTFGKTALMDRLTELAVKYCSFVLSTTESHGFSKTVRSVSFSTISDWFRDHGIVVGPHFIVDFINTGYGMAAIEKDKGKFLGDLMAQCCNENFIDGFMLECVTAGSVLPVIAFLNYVDYLDPSLVSSGKLLNVWKKNIAFAATVDYRKHDWLETIVMLFNEHTDFFNSVKSDTLYACQLTSVSSHASWGNVTTTTTYGANVENWLDSPAGPGKYRLRSSERPANTSSNFKPAHHGH